MGRHAADVPVDVARDGSAGVPASPSSATPTPVPSAPAPDAGSGLGRYLPHINIVSGNPDAVEVAAVTAVLAAMLEEMSGVDEAPAATAPSAWQRSQRALRQPHVPGAGQWRGFRG
jgi:hypothetical protein